MPLIKGKSKQAFSKNVETEMKHGKPQKQALAIAYATQRRSKMAKGGMAKAHAEESSMHSTKDIDMLEHDDHMDDETRSMAEMIMEHRRMKQMADGGMVDLEANAEEEPADSFDDLNEEAAKKELYDDQQLHSQPEDSNEHMDKIESDAHDMIDKLRNRMRLRRGY